VCIPENAVCHHLSFGPTFGGGYDLHVSSSSNTNKKSSIDLHSYEFSDEMIGREGAKLIVGGSGKFQTVEIEVFQVS